MNDQGKDHGVGGTDGVAGLVERLERCLDGWMAVEDAKGSFMAWEVPSSGPGSYHYIETVTEQAATALQAAEARAERAEKALEPFAKACEMLRFDPPQISWETEADGIVYGVDHDAATSRFVYNTLAADAFRSARSALKEPSQ